MDNQNFFGEVFGDPANDPLLEGEELEDDESEEAAEPSWVSETKRTVQDDTASDSSPSWGKRRAPNSREKKTDEGGAPSEKTITVELGSGKSLEEVNRSLKGGWRLIYICLDEKDRSGEKKYDSGTGSSSKKVLLTLRREEAGSLFDLG
jgi:hypothetical protein